MGLESYIQSARRNTPELKDRFNHKKEPAVSNLKAPKKNSSLETITKRGESTILVAKEKANFKWKKCPHIKKNCSEPVCSKFFSLCAKEKCKHKFAFGEE